MTQFEQASDMSFILSSLLAYIVIRSRRHVDARENGEAGI